MRRYVVAFSVAQAVAIAVPVALILLADIDLGSGVSVVGTLVSVMVAATLFVKDHHRSPTPAESLRLTWLSFGASICISLLAVALFVTAIHALGYAEDLRAYLETLNKVPVLFWVVVFSAVSGFYWVAIFLTYRWYGPFIENNLRKRSAL